MYIIIVGLGGIGRNLAKQAVEHAHTVVVIDQDEARCSELLEHYDVLAVTGNATDKTILEEAGVDRADAMIATTSDDSVNLMTCWLAKKFRVPNVVDRQPAVPFGLLQGSRGQDQREPGRACRFPALLLDPEPAAPAARLHPRRYDLRDRCRERCPDREPRDPGTQGEGLRFHRTSQGERGTDHPEWQRADPGRGYLHGLHEKRGRGRLPPAPQQAAQKINGLMPQGHQVRASVSGLPG